MRSSLEAGELPGPGRSQPVAGFLPVPAARWLSSHAFTDQEVHLPQALVDAHHGDVAWTDALGHLGQVTGADTPANRVALGL